MKIEKLKDHGLMVEVSREEAHSLIISLSQQMEKNDCNVGRREYTAEGVGYFSIVVTPIEKPDRRKEKFDEVYGLLGKKEKIAVDKWLAMGKHFKNMKDSSE